MPSPDDPEAATGAPGETDSHTGGRPGPQEEPAQRASSAAEQAGDSGPDERATESTEQALQRLRQEVEQANKHALQAQAEAENFRKRMRRDLEEQLKFAALPLVSDLLEVRDNLFRALEAADQNGGNGSAGLRDGVAMCAKQLDDMLAKHGVREIPALGEPFDPNVHEAISQMPSGDYEAGRVAHVALVGFQLHGRVVRPSQVVVSTGPPE